MRRAHAAAITVAVLAVTCGPARGDDPKAKVRANFAEDPAQASRYRATVESIRKYVADKCMTREGAYAAVAGGQIVDVSAALFPMWHYTAADSPEMIATMAALKRDFSSNHLYRRHLELFDSRREGAFLAGTFWVAHYYVIRGDLLQAQSIIEAGLKYANDLGLFAEEADPASLDMLGNLPQGFVHAAFINAAVDLRDKLAAPSPGIPLHSPRRRQ